MAEILLPTKKTQDEIKADTAKLIKETATQEGIDAILEILNSAPTGVVKSVQRGTSWEVTRDTVSFSIEKVDYNKSIFITTNTGSFVSGGQKTNSSIKSFSSNGGIAYLGKSGEEVMVRANARFLDHTISPSWDYEPVHWQVIEFY